MKVSHFLKIFLKYILTVLFFHYYCCCYTTFLDCDIVSLNSGTGQVLPVKISFDNEHGVSGKLQHVEQLLVWARAVWPGLLKDGKPGPFPGD